MKKRFVEFFTRKATFEIYFIKKGYLPNEDCMLQFDERNEKTETKFFLENYLNTELSMNGTATGKFDVTY